MNVGAFQIWWPLLVIISLVAILGASFIAFVEEREKNKSSIIFEFSPSEIYGQSKDGAYSQHPIVKVAPINGKLQLFSPFRLRIINRHPRHDIKVVINDLIWEHRLLFRRTRELGRLPLVSADRQLQSEIVIAVGKADRSEPIEVLFEQTWDGSANAVPRISHVVLRPEVLGAPPVEASVCKLENPKGLSWRVGAHEINVRESITAKLP